MAASNGRRGSLTSGPHFFIRFPSTFSQFGGLPLGRLAPFAAVAAAVAWARLGRVAEGFSVLNGMPRCRARNKKKRK